MRQRFPSGWTQPSDHRASLEDSIFIQHSLKPVCPAWLVERGLGFRSHLPLSWHPVQDTACTPMCVLVFRTALPANSIHFLLPLVLCISSHGSRPKGGLLEAGLSLFCAWQVWGWWPFPLWKGGCLQVLPDLQGLGISTRGKPHPDCWATWRSPPAC